MDLNFSFFVMQRQHIYTFQAIPYLGKHGERKVNLGREIVKQLAFPYHKTGRNVTCDNFFIDVELANHLSKKVFHSWELLGKVKPSFPETFKEDYMCHSFSCNRKTRRWQMVLFYNLLDTATVASHIIYKEVDTKSYKDRGFFNELLAKDLLLEHLMRRTRLAKTTKRVKLRYEILKLQWSLGNETVTRAGEKGKAVKGRCSRCPRKKDRKVRQVCSKCGEFVCNDH